MLDGTRIPPVDIETLPDDLREVLEDNASSEARRYIRTSSTRTTQRTSALRMRCGPPSNKRQSVCPVRFERCSTVASPRGTSASFDRTPMLP
jgi:hypothetical protein